MKAVSRRGLALALLTAVLSTTTAPAEEPANRQVPGRPASRPSREPAGALLCLEREERLAPPPQVPAPPGYRRLDSRGDQLWGGPYEDPLETWNAPKGEEREWAYPRPHDLGATADSVRSRLLGRPVSVGRVEEFVRYDLEGQPHRLSELLRDEGGGAVPLLALHWFAEWCFNCKLEAPFMVEMHRRWAPRGLRIVAIGEYSHPAKIREYVDRYEIPFLVLQGTRNAEDPDIRCITDHYRYRRSMGDRRKWGTPFTVFLEGGNARHVVAVAGEMRRRPVEAYLRAVLEPGS